MAACSAPSLENLPPPCISGYTACASTGVCVRDFAKDDPLELQREAQCKSREIRQGGSIVIPVPGATADQLPEVTSNSPELIAKLRVEGNSVVVDLKAEHGAALGDVPDHKVTIEATIAGHPYHREFPVLVQAIAASPTGRDTDPGSESQPFRTFRKAASVAGWGDTILLRNDGTDASEPDDTGVITLPAGVTVRGLVLPPSKESAKMAAPAKSAAAPMPKYEPVKLGMRLELAGRATLENLEISNHVALKTSDVNANVTVSYTSIAGGISVADSASQATLFITGNSHIVTKDPKTLSPVDVHADGATLSIVGDANIEYGDVTTKALVPVINMAGRRQHLIVHDRVRIHSDTYSVAIKIADAETVEIEGSYFLGRLELTGSAPMVSVSNADFAPGFSGSGIVLSADGAASMHVMNTNFSDEGISIKGRKSKVTVRHSIFRNFRLRGILLNAGTLDLGRSGDPGDNEFIPGPRGSSSDPLPVGLEIDAEPGAAQVTVSGTKFNEVVSAPCTITGPVDNAGFWKISEGSEIVFE